METGEALSSIVVSVCEQMPSWWFFRQYIYWGSLWGQTCCSSCTCCYK